MLSTFTGATDATLADVREEMKVRSTNELFLLFSMGSQFDHLIKQQLERLGVFCLVADPAQVTATDVQKLAPTGMILSGGPASVHAEPPPFDAAIFDLGIPTLGVCLGFQMWARHIGAPVVSSSEREFSVHRFEVLVSDSPLFKGLPPTFGVMQTHGDRIEPGGGMIVLGATENAPVSAGQKDHLWGVQFHPEVTHTEHGAQMYENFCFAVCGAKDRFPAEEAGKRKVQELREQVGDKKVLLALSGGADSSTVAYLLKEALAYSGRAPQVRGVYLRGIDRPDDEAFVHRYFGNQDWIEVKIVDASDAFLTALAGKTSMKEKRIAMRGIYKQILEEEANTFDADFIAQGTLYTDISESGGGYRTGARKAVIKVHHNTDLNFSIPELAPLDDCVKDGGRNIGRSIGVPEDLLVRHPFPGPGLVVRIEGEVTRETLTIARAVDGIYIEELRKWNLYPDVWQAGAVVTRSVTTATKGDDADEGYVIALWAVWSVNGFTAQWAELPNDFLRTVSQRITNEVRQAGAVVYRISDKPPTTIEWG